jgi:hypothetical protein
MKAAAYYLQYLVLATNKSAYDRIHQINAGYREIIDWMACTVWEVGYAFKTSCILVVLIGSTVCPTQVTSTSPAALTNFLEDI